MTMQKHHTACVLCIGGILIDPLFQLIWFVLISTVDSPPFFDCLIVEGLISNKPTSAAAAKHI